MPNPASLFSCRGPKTYAVSWRTENQIINSSYHKNSPDPVECYWITHNLTPIRIHFLVCHWHGHMHSSVSMTYRPTPLCHCHCMYSYVIGYVIRYVIGMSLPYTPRVCHCMYSYVIEYVIGVCHRYVIAIKFNIHLAFVIVCTRMASGMSLGMS
jgi:hypothetical protein